MNTSNQRSFDDEHLKKNFIEKNYHLTFQNSVEEPATEKVGDEMIQQLIDAWNMYTRVRFLLNFISLIS